MPAGVERSLHLASANSGASQRGLGSGQPVQVRETAVSLLQIPFDGITKDQSVVRFCDGGRWCHVIFSEQEELEGNELNESKVRQENGGVLV